jgi:hypothetical protein
MNNLYAVMFTVVAIIDFYATAAYIVAKTGSTDGIADLGTAPQRTSSARSSRRTGGTP